MTWEDEKQCGNTTSMAGIINSFYKRGLPFNLDKSLPEKSVNRIITGDYYSAQYSRVDLYNKKPDVNRVLISLRLTGSRARE
jgi:hypothetical protein